MRINKNLAFDCPMTARILGSASRKKTELIIRLAETQLKTLGYSLSQFRDKEDVKLMIEMMDRGFISGCPASSFRNKQSHGRTGNSALIRGKQNKAGLTGEADSELRFPDEGEAVLQKEKPADFKSEYLDAVKGILGEEEFESLLESEVEENGNEVYRD